MEHFESAADVVNAVVVVVDKSLDDCKHCVIVMCAAAVKHPIQKNTDCDTAD